MSTQMTLNTLKKCLDNYREHRLTHVEFLKLFFHNIFIQINYQIRIFPYVILMRILKIGFPI